MHPPDFAYIVAQYLIPPSAATAVISGSVVGSGLAASPSIQWDQVHFSLPVLVTAVVTVMLCTWVVAKYDNARIRKQHDQAKALKEMRRRLFRLERVERQRNGDDVFVETDTDESDPGDEDLG